MESDALPQEILLKERLMAYLPYAVVVLVLACVTILQVPADMVSPVNGMTLRWTIGVGAVALCVIGVTSRAREIRLDLQGFNDTKGRYHKWRDCSTFSVNVTRVGKIEMSDVRTTSAELGELWIWGNYGISNAELADLMNRFRARALGLAN